MTLPNGKQELLNTSTGAVTPLTDHAVLWCQKLPIYKVTALKGIEGGGMRQSAPVYFPCSVNGQATSKTPSSFPSTVGTLVNGYFVWPSPDGLQTRAGRRHLSLHLLTFTNSKGPTFSVRGTPFVPPVGFRRGRKG